MTLNDIYNIDGLLKQKFSLYEVREGQVKMSELIKQMIAEKRTAVIEGPTGVGKGFAYLIPSILSNEQVIVSTSNKSLQDQLDKKDLPTLQDVLGIPLSWAVLKGKNNYFCLEHFKMNEIEIKMELVDKAQGTEDDFKKAEYEMKQISDWAMQSDTGDLEYLPLDVSYRVRELIACDNHTTHEKDSEAYQYCFAAQAREKAKQARIVLVNHTLLALDLSLKRETEGKVGVLPQVNNIVMDEAHEFLKAASLAFSDEISIYSLIHLVRRTIVKNHVPKQKVEAMLNTLGSVLTNFLPKKNGIYYEPLKVQQFAELEQMLDPLDDFIHTLNQVEKSLDDKGQIMATQVIKEAEHLKKRMEAMSQSDDNQIRWAEAHDDRKGQPVIKLKTVPIDISQLIKESLFIPSRSVVACSATLAVSKSFSYFKEQIGMPLVTEELVVTSPFDYKQQALIYLSDGSLDKYYEMSELLRITKGRAFILFTSYKAMKDAYDLVQTEHPKIIQERTKPRSEILEEFKNTPNAVLFATRSFWEGVDVKGEQLSLVIIDKLPFEVPSDVIFSAKCQQIDNKFGRGQSFIRYSLPDMCIRLKQGIGRLIRSTTDKGIIAILDTRVSTKPYGSIILDSLPESYRTQQLAKVEKFFNK